MSDLVANLERAKSKVHQFEVGGLYSRDDVADLIGLPRERRRGAWLTGYARIADEFYLFANVGTAGRTGHDYPNRWDDHDFIWFGKPRTRLGQPEITDLLSGAYPVHIFWRTADRSPFTYAGLGVASEASGTTPVQVRWAFITPGSLQGETPNPPRLRRGPPPTTGTRTTEISEGRTSVYLLALEGPTAAVYPDLEPGFTIVKVGISTDVSRRIRELSCGFAPGCSLRWRLVAERALPSGRAAFDVETVLLHRLRLDGRWTGGEFAKVPQAELLTLANYVARGLSCRATAQRLRVLGSRVVAPRAILSEKGRLRQLNALERAVSRDHNRAREQLGSRCDAASCW